ncbi:MAG TPA: DUF488 domain-containing protein [Terriglobales bacterium]|nr:DUF488 domain-containing protein [Terriglobales bacterium]
MIQLKRAYDGAAAGDGRRILVERLWPRGVKKTDLPLDAWMKEVAPSTELRQWFSHDPAKWPEFQKRYTAELRAHAAALQPLLEAAGRRGKLTLIYSSHDEEHNNAVVLQHYLEERLKRKKQAA